MTGLRAKRCPDVLDARDGDPAHRRSLRVWLALQQALHLEPARAVALLARAGSVEAAARLAGCDRPDDPLQRARIDALARLGVKALPWLSDLYPDRLRELSDAAPLLLVRGEPAALLGRAVAIVGARAPTAYGLMVARDLATALAAAGVVVVSGLARGIDAEAHRAALRAGGLTVAFSACGPDLVYPREHASLADEIASAGAVVTEMPPGTPPLASYFPLRNRLISALAEIVVVVEGRLRSGSLVTARRALDQGRDVMAVPGPIDSPTSSGPNRLLREGAMPLCEISDVFRELGLAPPVRSTQAVPALGPAARRVVESLARDPAARDALAARLSLSAGELALALVELELAGLVETDRDGRLRALGGRSSGGRARSGGGA